MHRDCYLASSKRDLPETPLEESELIAETALIFPFISRKANSVSVVNYADLFLRVFTEKLA